MGKMRIGVGDGGTVGGGARAPQNSGKNFFGQFLCKIRAFSGKNHVKLLEILLIFRANIIKFWVF